MLVTGLGVTEKERLEHLQQSHLEDCERRKEHLMNSSTLLPSFFFFLQTKEPPSVRRSLTCFHDKTSQTVRM